MRCCASAAPCWTNCAAATGCRARRARTCARSKQAMATLQQQLGRPPSESEVAKSLKLSLADYQEMLGDSGGHQLVYYEDFHDERRQRQLPRPLCRRRRRSAARAARHRLPPGRHRRHRRAAAAREDADGPVLRRRTEPEGNRRRDGRVGIARLAAAHARPWRACAPICGSRRGPEPACSGWRWRWPASSSATRSTAASSPRWCSRPRSRSWWSAPSAPCCCRREAHAFVRGVRMLRWVFAPPPDRRQQLAREIHLWSLSARRDGLLSLEQYMAQGRSLHPEGPAPGGRRHPAGQAAQPARHRNQQPTNSASARPRASGNRRPAMRRRSASWAPCWA